MKIEYKGYKVSQDPETHHVSIFNQDGKRVFHSQVNEVKSPEELKETVDFFLFLRGNTPGCEQ